MATDVNESGESAGSVESVQQRISDLIANADDSGATTVEQATLEQLQEALQAQSQAGAFSSATPNAASENPVDLLDRNFAQWQAKIMLAVDEEVRSQLNEQFSKAETLSGQLAETCERLNSRQRELDDKALSVETRLSKALLKEAETSRARKALAKQLWAQKAATLAELAQCRQQQLEELESIARENAAADIRELEEALERESEERERLQAEFDETVRAYEKVTTDCEDAKASVAGEAEKLQQQQEKCAELESKLTEAEERRAAAEKQLEEKARELSDASEQAKHRDERFTNIEQALREAQDELKAAGEQLDARSRELESGQSGVEAVREELKIANDRLGEAESKLAESTKQVEGLTAQNENSNQRIAELEKELVEAEQRGLATAEGEQVERLQAEVESLQEQLKQQAKAHEDELDAENARLIQQIGSLQESLDAKQTELDELATTPGSGGDEESKRQIERLNTELSQAREELQSSKESHQNEIDAMRDQLSETLETITQLREQHEAMCSSEADADQLSKADAAHVQELESKHAELSRQLEDSLDQVDRLRIENAQLTERLQTESDPGSRPHVNFNQESLTWEERKKLIMQQLEHDDEEDPVVDQEAKLEIESIMQSTQAEIDRRDREIEELRSIVEQQSDTKQGVAVGAAAIAQMFESDELIVEEREKLKGIQAEWEEKVRQAEIDISMERAKLARERSQIEAKVEELEQRLAELPKTPAAEAKPQVRTRKWLDHLGLREEKDS